LDCGTRDSAVNEAFAKVTFKTPAGEPIGEATIDSEESQARLEDDEWFWSGGAPRGPRSHSTPTAGMRR